MSHLAIVGVGNRDLRCRVTVDGVERFLAPSADNVERRELASGLGLPDEFQRSGEMRAVPGARTIGAEINRQLADGRLTLDDLRYPLIHPFVSAVTQGREPLTVLLFATNQPDQAALARYRENDTIEIASLIARLIRLDFGSAVDVKIEHVTEAPHDREVAYRQVRDRLRPYQRALPTDDHPSVSVLPTGGIPAMSEALHFATFALWGLGGCQAFEAVPPADELLLSGAADSELRAFQPITVLRDFDARVMRAQVASYNYRGALTALERDGYMRSSYLGRLLDYGVCRLDLRFDDALAVVRGDQSFLALVDQLAPLTEAAGRPRAVALLRELTYNAELRWRCEQISEFVLWASLLHELLLRSLVSEWSGEAILWLSDEPESSQVSQSIVHAHLLSRRADRGPLDRWEWHLLATQLADNAERVSILSAVSKLFRLGELRNDLIHAGQATTAAEVCARLGVADEGDPVPAIKAIAGRVLDALGEASDWPPNPFDALNDDLLDHAVSVHFSTP